MLFRRNENHWAKIFEAGCLIAAGLILFKFLPMSIWGAEILYDASAHIAVAMWVLYVLWFFVDQNQAWHTPFFLLCAVVLSVIAFQRIADNAHNDVGLLGGFIVGLISIGIAERRVLRGRLKF